MLEKNGLFGLKLLGYGLSGLREKGSFELFVFVLCWSLSFNLNTNCLFGDGI